MADGVRRVGRWVVLPLCGLLVAGLAVYGLTAAGHDADRQQLLQLQAEYQTAMNANDVNALAPMTKHLAAGFKYTTITGDVITSEKDWAQRWQKVLAAIGKDLGGAYNVTVKPVQFGTHFLGDTAFSYGTTEESVTFAFKMANGQVMRTTREFSSMWSSVCKKEGSEWKLASVHSTMLKNPFSEDEVKQFKAAMARN